MKSILKKALQYERVRKVQRLVEQLRYHSPDVFKFRAHVGNDIIASMIDSKRPAAIGKIGATELNSLRSYLRSRKEQRCREITAIQRELLLTWSGVYPDNYDIFKKWSEFWLTSVLPEMTHLGVWFQINESYIIKKYAGNSVVFHSYGLEPYIFQNPWTAKLRGKTVVVVSPFEKTIQHQYPNRAEIWKLNPGILPDFHLYTIQCPHLPSLVPPVHQDWFESLEMIKEQIKRINYDVLLVGAGAYSLPLCTFAKSQGKIGIHLGGNTQLLFGILGKRWLVPKSSIDHKYFNNAWIHPLPEDTPKNCQIIEDGCYW